jgi:alkylation response protein AidB-like acyl-CoA dehydrogenase
VEAAELSILSPALADEIALRADEIEAARRLPNDLAQQLAHAGIFSMAVPKAYGGGERAPTEIVETIEAAARADGSVGWCVMIASTTSMNAAYLAEDFARTIYSDPLMITGGVFAPMGKAVVEGDGYRVTGRWQWASGSQNCGWLLGGALVFDEAGIRSLPNGAPDARMMYWPANEATLIDTWYVTGLKGTGSLDMAVDNVFVPAGRTVSLVSDKPRVSGPLYKFPPFGLLALGIAGVALGNARGAMDAFVALASAKKPQGSRKTLAERVHTQIQVAEAEASLLAARSLLFNSISDAWALAQAGSDMPQSIRARLRMAATFATRTAADVTRTLYDLGGGSAVYLNNNLQRRFRDAHVMTQHIMVAPATWELTGRTLLGLPTEDSML